MMEGEMGTQMEGPKLASGGGGRCQDFGGSGYPVIRLSGYRPPGLSPLGALG